MKTTIKFSFGEVKMNARIIDGDAQFPGEDSRFYHHYKYQISLSYDGRVRKFTYMTSYYDWHEGKEELDESDFKHALNCFLSDSYAAQDSFEFFCNEFGYSNDSIKALKIYKACKRDAKKAKFVFADLDLLKIQNELEEME